MNADAGVPVPSTAIPGRKTRAARALRLAGKVRQKLTHKLVARWAAAGDARASTYANASRIPGGGLLRFFSPCAGELLRPSAALIRGLAENFLEHRFDLLGSGWVRVEHGMTCAGVEGHRFPPAARVPSDQSGDWLRGRVTAANFPEAHRVWTLVDRAYRPIDWHLDFKSGYRWPETTWFGHIGYGQAPGVDIKVPWELARMQHLAVLAHAFALARAGEPGGRPAAVYQREFRNEVLDFVATNPPRFGVNWQCAMDVAIRAANWLVAFDLFRAAGAEFDREFEEVFVRSIYEHGAHVRQHLEWSEHFRGNHYLADVAGLLFVAAFLPRSAETDEWLAFAVAELIREFGTQFCEDGGNFEASTNYHRLSAEMVVYGTALVLGLPEGKKQALRECAPTRPGPKRSRASAPLEHFPRPDGAGVSPFPAWYWERLGRVFAFSSALADAHGRVPQFGDNDSGRFLKLLPAVQAKSASAATTAETTWTEDVLNHDHLLAALAGLFEPPPGARRLADAWRLETAVVRGLARWTGSGGRSAVARVPTPVVRDPAKPVFQVFPQFGAVVAECGLLRAVIRCGPVGQCGIGGHAHNDPLSFELSVAGQPLVVDPGSYLYTPLPTERNRFRAAAAHSTLAVEGREPNPWGPGKRGLFLLREHAHARIVELTDHAIVMEHNGFGVVHRRTLWFSPGILAGRDECVVAGNKSVGFPLAPGCWNAMVAGGDVVLTGAAGARVRFGSGNLTWMVVDSFYSGGYGWKQSSQTLRLGMAGAGIEWRIQVERE
ncbi:hypothetical protein LBMAG56_01630 [Verrucomicrobiota bacterium]|nr:hypothetical protein LBMAG56_01630 [Verrucomicrobiota bacterium]